MGVLAARLGQQRRRLGGDGRKDIGMFQRQPQGSQTAKAGPPNGAAGRAAKTGQGRRDFIQNQPFQTGVETVLQLALARLAKDDPEGDDAAGQPETLGGVGQLTQAVIGHAVEDQQAGLRLFWRFVDQQTPPAGAHSFDRSQKLTRIFRRLRRSRQPHRPRVVVPGVVGPLRVVRVGKGAAGGVEEGVFEVSSARQFVFHLAG